MVSTPLFPEQVEFEEAVLAHNPMLKKEYWDLTNHERLTHLATRKYMTKIYYEDTGVTLFSVSNN